MSQDLALLNLFEVEDGGATRHLVCFLEPVRAGAVGIDTRTIVGEYRPGADGGFDLGTFRPNPGFAAVFTDYMNAEAARAPELIEQARQQPGRWLYLVDPRARDPEGDVPPGDVVGCFAVDDSGQIAPNSFQYNANHLWFDPAVGPSGILGDRNFYDWLNRPQG